MKDLVGKTFGKLEVLRQTEQISNAGRQYLAWWCKCSCGKELAVPAQYLRAGKKSCGCLSPGPKLLTASEQLFRIYKRSADQKHRGWHLDFGEFFALTQKPCHYCGVAPFNSFKHNRDVFTYNGIDRKENAVDYIWDNLVPCCWICNRAKLDLTYSQFLEYLNRICTFRPQIRTSDRSSEGTRHAG